MGNDCQKKVFIIAEAGVNHNGSLELARQLIDEAAAAGADAVKFQTFQPEDMVRRNTEKAEYQKAADRTSESQYEMLQRLVLSRDSHYSLDQYCRDKSIQFLSSPFDLPSIELLVALDLPIFKIPSGEITNLPYLRKIGSLNRKVILSTGMAEEDEIEAALNVLVGAGTQLTQVVLLHCTTAYPAPFEEVNLRAMLTMQNTFGTQVGYSDHTLGIEVAIAAAALGASVIEKHFTLDHSLPGPDHKASLVPHELQAMVSAVRNIEQALGMDKKTATTADLKNRDLVRKSIVAACNIRKGDVFTESNLAVKRPGTGLTPMQWDSILGKEASRNYTKDSFIIYP